MTTTEQHSPVTAQAFTAMHALRILRRRMWWALLAAAVTMATTWIVLNSITPMYQAEAKLGIERVKQYTTDSAFDTETGLRVEYGQLNALREEILARPVLVATLVAAGEVDRPPYAGMHNPAAVLESRTRVVTSRDSWAITLQVTAEHPERATRLCQSLVDSYIASVASRRLNMAKEAELFLAQQVEEAQEKLDEVVAKEQQFRIARGIAAGTQESNQLTRRLDQLAIRIADFERSRAELAALTERVAVATAAPPEESLRLMLSIDRIASNPRVASGLADVRAAEAQSASLALKFGPRHPRMIEAQTLVASKRTVLDEAVATAKAAIEEQTQLNQLERREVDQQKAKLDLEIAAQRADFIAAGELAERVTASREILAKRRAELAKVQYASKIEKGFVYVIEPASSGLRPANKPRPVFIACTLICGLIAALLAAIIAELCDRRIGNLYDVSRIAPWLPVIGRIPLVRADALLDSSPDRPPEVAEAFRRLRTALVSGGATRTLLITSSQQGDGKSTIALRLAHSFARTGMTTLLIDADLRHARLTDSLDQRGAQGFADLLEGRSALPHHLATNLDFLPCGVTQTNPGDILTSGSMAAVMQRLSAHHALVILDTPPLAAVADAAAMAESTDAILLVVRAQGTSRRRLQEALLSLTPLRNRLRGMVLNGDRELDLSQLVTYLGLSERRQTGPTAAPLPPAVVTKPIAHDADMAQAKPEILLSAPVAPPAQSEISHLSPDAQPAEPKMGHPDSSAPPADPEISHPGPGTPPTV